MSRHLPEMDLWSCDVTYSSLVTSSICSCVSLHLLSFHFILYSNRIPYRCLYRWMMPLTVVVLIVSFLAICAYDLPPSSGSSLLVLPMEPNRISITSLKSLKLCYRRSGRYLQDFLSSARYLRPISFNSSRSSSLVLSDCS